MYFGHLLLYPAQHWRLMMPPSNQTWDASSAIRTPTIIIIIVVVIIYLFIANKASIALIKNLQWRIQGSGWGRPPSP